MVKKVLRPFSFCPFFNLCEDRVNWFYVTEVCLADYRTCDTYRYMVKKDCRTPDEWMDTVYGIYSRVGMDRYFSLNDWRKCPFFVDCEVKVTFEELESYCADKFSTCGYYMKHAMQKKMPGEWWSAVSLMLGVMNDRDKSLEPKGL
jgi:hypothetical protein